MTIHRAWVLTVPWLWLSLFLIAPLIIVALIAFAEPTDSVPPFSLIGTTKNLERIATDPLYRYALGLSLKVAGLSTLACLLMGYPMALAIARAPVRWRDPLLLAVMLPFWTGFLMRINAWIGLLRDDGLINTGLAWFGVEPMRLLYTDSALFLGMLYTYLPFMVLPLYARLSRQDPLLAQAAADLGAGPWRVFWRITAPLSLPGVWAGCALVFIPAVGEYVIPELLGGPQAQLMGRTLWQEFFQNRDWPTASALAIVLLVLLLAPASLLGIAAMSRKLIAWLILCYAFLYLPILFLIVFSFNDSRLVTTWSGLSLRWYTTLAHDQTLQAATLLSLRVAVASATLATLVGTAAGYALARFGSFRGRAALATSLTAPLVLPEVITGLSLLLLFVSLQYITGWPTERGAGTVTLAHAAVSVSYVAMVVQARLADAGTVLEEAAADLYAPPWTVFRLVTLPLLAPALLTGWLLAFTLSMDDVVVASFTSGPGASTLPMVVFSATRLGVTPEIYALATVIVAVVAAGLAVQWTVSLIHRAGHSR